MHMHVGRARNPAYTVRDLLGDLIVVMRVAGHLEVDGSRQAEVQNLTRNVRRLEEERQLRELLRQIAPQLLDKIRGRAVPLLQGDQNLAIGGADTARCVIGEVDATDRQADVVQNQIQLAGGNGLPYGSLHLRKEALRRLDACASGRTHVQTELPGIDGGEEILADERQQARRADKQQAIQAQNGATMVQRRMQPLPVPGGKSFEVAVEHLMDTPHNVALRRRPVIEVMVM